MRLELTTWERLRLVMLVNELRGVPLATIRKGMKALDVLELTEEERSTVGLRLVQGRVTWADTEHKFVVEIEDKEAASLVVSLVRQLIRNKNKGGWDMEDFKLLALAKKLGIDPDGGVEDE